MTFYVVTYWEEDEKLAEELAWSGQQGFPTVKREKYFKTLNHAEEWAKNNFSSENDYRIALRVLDFGD